MISGALKVIGTGMAVMALPFVLYIGVWLAPFFSSDISWYGNGEDGQQDPPSTPSTTSNSSP